jgi:EAL domain-containing protein (putative c-di-GMP-specific phosphodiesterase class I)
MEKTSARWVLEIPETMTIPSQIKNMIKDFRRQVVEVASQDTGTQAVYQLNIQLFPLIEIKDNLPKPPATDEVDP